MPCPAGTEEPWPHALEHWRAADSGPSFDTNVTVVSRPSQPLCNPLLPSETDMSQINSAEQMVSAQISLPGELLGTSPAGRVQGSFLKVTRAEATGSKALRQEPPGLSE